MATRLTPLGKVVKWLIVPLSLGAVGYFLVGPRVESQVPDELKKKVQEVAGTSKQTSEPTSSEGSEENPPPDEEESKPTRTFAEPQVDVSVTALNSQPKKKKKRRRKPRVETAAPSGPTAPEAPVSGGGGTEPPPPVSDGTL